MKNLNIEFGAKNGEMRSKTECTGVRVVSELVKVEYVVINGLRTGPQADLLPFIVRATVPTVSLTDDQLYRLLCSPGRISPLTRPLCANS